MQKTTKPIIVVLVLTLVISMSSICAYASSSSGNELTVGAVEQEVEKYLRENKPEIELGSEAYIEYLVDLLTYEDDPIIAENQYYDEIKIYASEYLSQLNEPNSINVESNKAELIVELNSDIKEKTIEDVILEAKAEEIMVSQISVIKEPEYSTMATYSDSAAVKYARKYCESRNAQYNKYSSDCTNFVSQCVKAGGKNMTKPSSIPTGIKSTTTYWYSVRYLDGNNEVHYKWKESSSFIRVADFYTYWKGKGITTASYSTKAKLQNGAAIGDVVQLKNGDGKWYHSIIITGGTKGDRTYCAHSKNRSDESVSGISGAVSYRALKF